jgi:hypothetical protein
VEVYEVAVHYFPVSQDINADLEVWELTDRFGVTGIRAWLEVLSIADRNNGVLPGLWSEYPRLLAARCQSTTKHLVGVCQFITRWLTVDSQGTARVTKYAKYHKIRAERSTAPNPPNQPNQPNTEQKLLPAPPNGVADNPLLPGLPPATGKKKKRKVEPPDTEFSEAFQAWPNHEDREAARVNWRKAHVTPEILALVKAETAYWTEEVDSGRKDKQYVPMFKNWLRGKRWNDHHVEKEQEPQGPPPKIIDRDGEDVILEGNRRMKEKNYERQYPQAQDRKSTGHSQ